MPKKKYKIVAIDDDPNTLLLLEAILESHDFNLVLLNTNKNAVETIRKEKPDLILLDIMMPHDDGYTILNRVKADDAISNIPVIMVTALELDGNKVFASICGASAYVTKPIDRVSLINAISRLLPDSV